MKIKDAVIESSTNQREALLERIERYTELPLMIFAVVMIPLLVGPMLWDMAHDTEMAFLALDLLIWAIFAIDFVVKLAVSTSRVQYMKRHWIDVLVIAVPWFRPLRIIRVIVLSVRSYQGAARVGKPDFLLLYAVALVILAATAITTIEQGNQSDLGLFHNALWWSVVTITTVGYGDMVPGTEAGRAIAYVLMFGGIGIFGAITANLAALFVKPNNTGMDSIDHLAEEIKMLRSEITRMSKNTIGPS